MANYEKRAYSQWASLIQKEKRRMRAEKDLGAPIQERICLDIDPSWRSSDVFIAQMGECPDHMTLMQYDQSKRWDKHNCQWALKGKAHRDEMRRLDNRGLVHVQLKRPFQVPKPVKAKRNVARKQPHERVRTLQLEVDKASIKVKQLTLECDAAIRELRAQIHAAKQLIAQA